MGKSDPWSKSPVAKRETKAAAPNQERLRRRFARWTFAMSVVNLFFSIGLVWLVVDVSEHWWLSGVIVYLPQTPWLVPSVCLLACSLVWHMRSALLNLTSLGLIALNVCGLSVSMKGLHHAADTGQQVRVVSCNVQNFEPNFGKVLREFRSLKPDIIVLQEARDVPDVLFQQYKDWHWQQYGEFLTGSRWPIHQSDTCTPSPYGLTRAMKCEVECPDGLLVVSNIHLQTARVALGELDAASIISGDGPDLIEHHVFLRDEEALQVRAFLENTDVAVAHIVAGDFNMPENSSIYQDRFGDLTNTFAEAGFGFGYTAPCRPHRFWPPGTPWVRIDHILVDGPLEPLHSTTGSFNGSDHRLVFTVLELPNVR